MELELQKIVKPLLKWYQISKRDLPWRHTTDSYKIWISEIMLQQTRVEAVKHYYETFIKEIPDLKALANIKEDKLLKIWEGLGYYSRARNMQKCAQLLIKENQKELPRCYEKLKKLPGIGPYTAASIGSIAYQLKTPAIDGNVLRIMTRIHEDDRNILDNKVRNDYFNRLSKIMPDDTRNFTESLMELGALICQPNGLPKCENCPINFCCKSYHHQTMLKFPTKRKEKTRKKEKKTVIIFEFENKIAIQKRPNKGLLASLYEFYNIDEHYTLREIKQLLEKKKIIFNKIENLGKNKHIFSHIEWDMIGYYINCEKLFRNDLKWVSKEELQEKYSLPTAFSYYAKFLKR